jgi:hypothetical protein
VNWPRKPPQFCCIDIQLAKRPAFPTLSNYRSFCKECFSCIQLMGSNFINPIPQTWLLMYILLIYTWISIFSKNICKLINQSHSITLSVEILHSQKVEDSICRDDFRCRICSNASKWVPGSSGSSTTSPKTIFKQDHYYDY